VSSPLEKALAAHGVTARPITAPTGPPVIGKGPAPKGETDEERERREEEERLRRAAKPRVISPLSAAAETVEEARRPPQRPVPK